MLQSIDIKGKMQIAFIPFKMKNGTDGCLVAHFENSEVEQFHYVTVDHSQSLPPPEVSKFVSEFNNSQINFQTENKKIQPVDYRVVLVQRLFQKAQLLMNRQPKIREYVNEIRTKHLLLDLAAGNFHLYLHQFLE